VVTFFLQIFIFTLSSGQRSAFAEQPSTALELLSATPE
jgi:hypothetical protein